jgi:hypothetical protein
MALWALVVLLPGFVMCWFNLMHQHNASEREEEALCSCQYDKESSSAPGHLLDPWECVDAWERLDSWLQQGCAIDSNDALFLHKTVAERLRIPWIGGAKKIDETLLPLLFAPMLFFFGSMCFICNAIQFFATALILGLATRWTTSRQASHRRRSGFIATWLLVDTTLVFLSFAHDVRLDLSVTVYFVVMIALHISTRISDPGVIQKEKELKESSIVNKASCSVDNAVSEMLLDATTRRVCETCGVLRFERSKHCRLCNHCVNGTTIIQIFLFLFLI